MVLQSHPYRILMSNRVLHQQKHLPKKLVVKTRSRTFFSLISHKALNLLTLLNQSADFKPCESKHDQKTKPKMEGSLREGFLDRPI